MLGREPLGKPTALTVGCVEPPQPVSMATTARRARAHTDLLPEEPLWKAAIRDATEARPQVNRSRPEVAAVWLKRLCLSVAVRVQVFLDAMLNCFSMLRPSWG